MYNAIIMLKHKMAHNRIVDKDQGKCEELLDRLKHFEFQVLQPRE